MYWGKKEWLLSSQLKERGGQKCTVIGRFGENMWKKKPKSNPRQLPLGIIKILLKYIRDSEYSLAWVSYGRRCCYCCLYFCNFHLMTRIRANNLLEIMCCDGTAPDWDSGDLGTPAKWHPWEKHSWLRPLFSSSEMGGHGPLESPVISGNCELNKSTN